MAVKKEEARLDAVEEQMEKVWSDLQKLDQLEKGIVSLLDRMTVLDRVDQVIQKLDASSKAEVIMIDRGKVVMTNPRLNSLSLCRTREKSRRPVVGRG
ncbi:hypothetical protein TIFTF001_022833 [Ficus carica]|uniref:Uncharacterized protein n=1 Tax=Ficus carica TaxID=3494 RepID=A0AA88AKQ7_FICCA|nr:hypothetical protein TIFTF001_022833 [Ficus carica]